MFSYQIDSSLKPFNTFGIDVKAKFLAEAGSLSDLKTILFSEDFKNTPKIILGGGSNVLFTKDFEGLVVLMKIKGIETVKDDEEFIWLKAGAGENWHHFVLYTIENNFGGIENLSLIPGTVGAAPMQNIGAYGVEIKDVFESLEAISLENGEIQTFNKLDCQFGYRESVFKHELKGKFIITSVTFKLKKNPTEYTVSYGEIQNTLKEMGVTDISLKAVSEAVIHIRQSKLPDPKVIGNAGSFFKNPEVPSAQYQSLKEKYPAIPGYTISESLTKVPAGWLIEQCGWKGKQIGETGVHAKQALVLVNYGNANGDEIWKLALEIQHSVKEKFGILIQPEVNRI